MANHIEIKTETDTFVHIEAPFGVDYTLCGLETCGDTWLKIKPGKITQKSID